VVSTAGRLEARRSGLMLRNRTYLLLDLVAWALIPLAALGLVLGGFAAEAPYLGHAAWFALIGAVCKSGALWWFGLYRRYWRYASIDELILIGEAVAVSGLTVAVLYGLILGPWVDAVPRLPGAALIADTLLTLFYVGLSRFAPRLVDHLRVRLKGVGPQQRVLVAGAGFAGTMIARELQANPQHRLEVVGFVDDDRAKLGNTIQGVPVLGGRHDIPALARDYAVSEVIIAMPTAPGTVIREIRDLCETARVQAKTIPGVFDILSGKVSIKRLRDVEIDDLLRRKPVETDQRAVQELVRGMTVLVTGAGGSIGSEICRQVAALGAAEIVLLGHGENSLFEAIQDLLREFPAVRFTPVVADIRDTARTRRIFSTFRPHTVFHAAAHKHVPLMESNPEEAVTNNVFGTTSVVAAAEASGVSRFVFISTDKAVNPQNIMGATKLLAEQLVHDAAERTGRAYVSVRFGNVLASRGSVVPVFKKQIIQGGPVTVTHPEVCRYFMTIPEAVQLVLQAAALGRGGETFVLDMGEPVKIVDLARDLIRLSGLEVGRDVSIVFTGLRPGEKLTEELFGEAEDVQPTAHDKVFVVRNGKGVMPTAQRTSDLQKAVTGGDAICLRHLLEDLVRACPNGDGKPGDHGGPRENGKPTAEPHRMPSEKPAIGA